MISVKKRDGQFLRSTTQSLRTVAVVQKCSFKKSLLKIPRKYLGKHLCWGLFLIATLFKKRLWHRCFSVIFAKFLRAAIL